jgi:hypothetical protein
MDHPRRTLMKPIQTNLFAALLATCFSCQAHAQWTGTYEYKEKGFTGKMVVTDVSMCELEKSVTCLMAVRPLTIVLNTTDKNGDSKCAVKLTENPSGRIGYPTSVDAMFPADKTEGKPASWIEVEFRKGAAVVRLSAAETPAGTCEGTGRFIGKWRKI